MIQPLILKKDGNIIAESGRYGRYTEEIKSVSDVIHRIQEHPEWIEPVEQTVVQPVKWYVRLWNFLKGLFQ